MHYWILSIYILSLLFPYIQNLFPDSEKEKLAHSLYFCWGLKVPKASWVISHYVAVTEGCAVNTEIIWAMVNDSAVRATGPIKDRASCTRHLSGPWITHTHAHTSTRPAAYRRTEAGWATENANTHPQFSFVLASPHFSFSVIFLLPLNFSLSSPQSLLPSREEMAAYGLSLNC